MALKGTEEKNCFTFSSSIQFTSFRVSDWLPPRTDRTGRGSRCNCMLFLCDCFALGSPHPQPTSERPLRRAVLSVPLSGGASVDLQTGGLAQRGARAFPPHIWADAVPTAGALRASSSSTSRSASSMLLLLLLLHPPEYCRTSPQHSVRS